MDDKELTDFLADLYMRSSGAPLLIDYLVKRGKISKSDFKAFFRKELKKI